MQICQVCFWEDAPGEFPYNSSNAISLAVAQENFTEFGAVERKFLDIVRRPNTAESRLPGWMSVDETRLKILELIREAFADVHLDGGVSLHQSRVLDDYGDEDEFKAALRKDPEWHWTEVSTEKIKQFCDSLVFFDPKGVRFYLPAFMTHALETYEPTYGWLDADGIFFAASDPTGGYKDKFEALNSTQMSAVAAFLAFVNLYSSEFTSRHDRQMLTNFWARHFPDFIKI